MSEGDQKDDKPEELTEQQTDEVEGGISRTLKVKMSEISGDSFDGASMTGSYYGNSAFDASRFESVAKTKLKR